MARYLVNHRENFTFDSLVTGTKGVYCPILFLELGHGLATECLWDQAGK